MNKLTPEAREYFAEQGRKGAAKLKELHGEDYFKNLAKQGQRARGIHVPEEPVDKGLSN